MEYVIHCEVTGGITGRRVAFLKDDFGNTAVFPDRETADAVVVNLRDAVRGMNTRCIFTYYAVPRTGGEN